jgi:hypothetical protein
MEDAMDILLSSDVRYDDEEQGNKNLLESEEDVSEEEGELELKRSQQAV